MIIIWINWAINIFTTSIFCAKRKIQKNSSLKSSDCVFTKIHDISKTFDAKILNVEYDPDHIHMIFTLKSTLNIPKYITTIKAISLRELRKKIFLKLIQCYDKTHYSQCHISQQQREKWYYILEKSVESQSKNTTSVENTNLSNWITD